MKKSTDILKLSKNSLIALKSLRSDHIDKLNIKTYQIDSNESVPASQDEKLRRLKKSLEKIELGIDEIEV